MGAKRDMGENLIHTRPKGCILLLTLECIFKCRMCNLWKVKKDGLNRPSLEQWKHFISSFDGFVEKGSTENRFTITFGGGEPLLYKQELLELVQFSSARNLWASIASNGYLLDREFIDKLLDLKVHYVGLSLDSLSEEKHDFLRGVKGSYKKVMEAVEYLAAFKEGPVLAINTIIMKPNLDDIPELAKWAAGKERVSSILLQAIMQPFHDPMVEGWQALDTYAALWPDNTEKVKSVIDGLIRMKRSGPDKISNPVSQLEVFKEYFTEPKGFLERIKCRVLDSGFFSVSPNGDVNLCPFTEPIGNIKDGTLEELWHSAKAGEVRNRMLLCKNGCHHLINCWYEERPSHQH